MILKLKPEWNLWKQNLLAIYPLCTIPFLPESHYSRNDDFCCCHLRTSYWFLSIAAILISGVVIIIFIPVSYPPMSSSSYALTLSMSSILCLNVYCFVFRSHETERQSQLRPAMLFTYCCYNINSHWCAHFGFNDTWDQERQFTNFVIISGVFSFYITIHVSSTSLDRSQYLMSFIRWREIAILIVLLVQNCYFPFLYHIFTFFIFFPTSICSIKFIGVYLLVIWYELRPNCFCACRPLGIKDTTCHLSNKSPVNCGFDHQEKIDLVIWGVCCYPATYEELYEIRNNWCIHMLKTE